MNKTKIRDSDLGIILEVILEIETSGEKSVEKEEKNSTLGTYIYWMGGRGQTKEGRVRDASTRLEKHCHRS